MRSRAFRLAYLFAAAAGLHVTACWSAAGDDDDDEDLSPVPGPDSSVGDASGDDSADGGDAEDGEAQGVGEEEGSGILPTGNASEAGDADEGGEAQVPVSYVRLANWSPDAPASGLDVCIAFHGTGMFQGPLFARIRASVDGGTKTGPGLPFPEVTAYAAFTPGSYDVRVVAPASVAEAQACAVGLGPDAESLPALASFAYSTFAIVGDKTPAAGDPSLRAVELFDDQSVGATYAALRFVDVAPSVPAADFGLGAVGAMFEELFAGARFAEVATVSPADAGSLDSNGYLFVAPFQHRVMSARATSTPALAAATAPDVSLPAGSAVTMALVNGKTGGRSPQLLQCADNGPPAGPLGDCKVVSP